MVLVYPCFNLNNPLADCLYSFVAYTFVLKIYTEVRNIIYFYLKIYKYSYIFVSKFKIFKVPLHWLNETSIFFDIQYRLSSEYP